MKEQFITPSFLWQELIEDRAHIIDVRAPVEFTAGRIPHSVNLPILTDAERAEVGTLYKEKGSQSAIERGYQIVQGVTKQERLGWWMDSIKKHSDKKTYLTCFRGGMRSGITQTWLAEQGWPLLRLKGGYKAMRQLMTEYRVAQCQSRSLVGITGKTGSGKTKFLKKLPSSNTLDLEALAHHRGSAFGGKSEAQPSQADYENRLALAMARRENSQKLFVEDESRMIGSITQPAEFFELLRKSPVYLLEEPLEVRIENTLQEYVIEAGREVDPFIHLKASLFKIQKKLGHLRYTEILNDMLKAEQSFKDHRDLNTSKVWIEKLLIWYYDPLYESSLQRRSPLVLEKGNAETLLAAIGKL